MATSRTTTAPSTGFPRCHCHAGHRGRWARALSGVFRACAAAIPHEAGSSVGLFTAPLRNPGVVDAARLHATSLGSGEVTPGKLFLHELPIIRIPALSTRHGARLEFARHFRGMEQIHKDEPVELDL